MGTFIYTLIDVMIVLLVIYLFIRFVNPVRSVEATVVGKYDETSETTKESRRSISPEEKTTRSGYVFYLITFELENGKGKNFLAFEKYPEQK